MWFGGDLNEYLQVKYAPNGDIYGSFCKRMRRGAGKPGGWHFAAHAGSRLQGVLGRMTQGLPVRPGSHDDADQRVHRSRITRA